MKPLGSIESASNDILKNARNIIKSLYNHAVHEPITITEAIKTLKHIRIETYESLNQIQHEFLIIQAVKRLQTTDPTLVGASWLWNPRQTGSYDEPDLRAVHKEVNLVSAEVTTSAYPKGLIDSRMRDTLAKLSKMQGRKFYFVLTEEMRRRAQTKVTKNGWDINIIVINSDTEI